VPATVAGGVVSLSGGCAVALAGAVLAGCARVAAFEELVAGALAAAFSGWDFCWLGRPGSDPPRWDCSAPVAALAGGARMMLDMGTGGGEVLSGLPAWANRTLATKARPPDVPVAGRPLPRGIRVIQTEAARDDMEQDGLTTAAACRSVMGRWTC
jgi:hypothetical protein